MIVPVPRVLDSVEGPWGVDVPGLFDRTVLTVGDRPQVLGSGAGFLISILSSQTFEHQTV